MPPVELPRLDTLLTLRMLFLQAQSFCPGSVFSRSASAYSYRSLARRLPDLAIPVDRVKVAKLRWNRYPQTSDGRFFRSELSHPFNLHNGLLGRVRRYCSRILNNNCFISVLLCKSLIVLQCLLFIHPPRFKYLHLARGDERADSTRIAIR